jgi:hypothetical protein
MKLSSLILLLLFSTSTFYCQEVSNENESKSIFDRNHEIKIGAVKLLFGGILETTYEFIHSKEFTYGSSILVNFDSKNDYPENFSITPFARFYFQESKEFGAEGFFVEGFAKYSSGKNTYKDDINPENYSAVSGGLSIGKKWINNSGFVFESLIGVGRVFGNSTNSPDATFRGDLFLGYRF